MYNECIQNKEIVKVLLTKVDKKYSLNNVIKRNRTKRAKIISKMLSHDLSNTLSKTQSKFSL